MSERCCALESCGKPLVKRGDEPPSRFKKRRYCNHSCAGFVKRENNRRAKRKAYRPGGGSIEDLCEMCGTLPHRVPGGPGCVCPKCGTVYAPDRVKWEGSLVQSNACMALPHSVE